MAYILLYIVIFIVVAAVALRISIPFLSRQPDTLGVKNGQLPPCPNSPNCVSSFETKAEHGVEPLAFIGTVEQTHADLLTTLHSLPRVAIVTNQPTYIHATTRSRIMGYVDDNEFLLDEEAGVIHVRASARLGRSDLGANRARIEAIREQMNQKK